MSLVILWTFGIPTRRIYGDLVRDSARWSLDTTCQPAGCTILATGLYISPRSGNMHPNALQRNREALLSLRVVPGRAMRMRCVGMRHYNPDPRTDLRLSAEAFHNLGKSQSASHFMTCQEQHLYLFDTFSRILLIAYNPSCNAVHFARATYPSDAQAKLHDSPKE